MKISITLANYNHGRYLGTYFEGILRQTYQDWELIITDDGSTDDSREIIRRHAAADRRIKVEEFPENRGSMPAFYNCFNRVSGDLLYATASDDYLLDPRFFEKAAAAFERHPGLGVFYGNEEIRDAVDGSLLGFDGRAPFSGYVPPGQCMEAFMRKDLLIPGCCAILRKLFIDQSGGYPAELGPWCDYYLNHAVAGKHGAFYEGSLFAYARLDPAKKNLSTRLSLEEMLANNFLICRRFWDDGFFAEVSRAALNEWIEHEVRQSVSWAYGWIRTLKNLGDLVRGQQLHPGISDRLRSLLAGTFSQELDAEGNLVAARVMAAVADFDVRMQSLVSTYRTNISEPSFLGVLKFVNDRHELRKQISTRLAEYAHRIREYETIVVYGMGSHSSIVLEEWKSLGLPAIRAMTSSEAGDSGEFCGIPIVSLRSLKGARLLVVLSSLAFESVMFSNLRAQQTECGILSFWNPGLTRL